MTSSIEHGPFAKGFPTHFSATNFQDVEADEVSHEQTMIALSDHFLKQFVVKWICMVFIKSMRMRMACRSSAPTAWITELSSVRVTLCVSRSRTEKIFEIVYTIATVVLASSPKASARRTYPSIAIYLIGGIGAREVWGPLWINPFQQEARRIFCADRVTVITEGAGERIYSYMSLRTPFIISDWHDQWTEELELCTDRGNTDAISDGGILITWAQVRYDVVKSGWITRPA